MYKGVFIKIVNIFLLLMLTSNIFAQVTIGSTIPPLKGALLDLKDGTVDPNNLGVTASRGLGLPRVALQAISGDLGKSLDSSVNIEGNLDKDEHIGLVVYNTNKDESSEATRLCPGIHVWNGEKWESLTPYPVVKSTKVVISKEVISESGRENITGTPGYEPGPLGQYIDTRGPSGVEVNKYHYARFYAYRVDVSEGSITYKGIRNTNACDPTQAVEETWTESAPFQYIDDGIWMTENMNTKYMTATATTPIDLHPVHPTEEYLKPQYTTPASTGLGVAEITQDGLLYNWAAATNKKGGTDGMGNVDNPNMLEEQHSLQKERQGICPDGCHIPSDKEWNELEAAIAASDNTDYTNSTAIPYTWTTVDNTTLGDRGTTHGVSMSSVRSGGDSKSASNGGFNALFTGNAYGQAAAINYGETANIWSSSCSEWHSAWARTIYKNRPKVFRFKWDRTTLYSVRCKK